MVTHHIEEILPEMSQLILLKEGKLLASGSKEELLAGPMLGELFDAQVKVECDGGWYWPRFTPAS
jgi:iron complex transport system ATP-binding protein